MASLQPTVLFCTRVEPLLHLASRVQGSSPHFGPQPSAFLRGLAQHDPNGERFYIQLVCRSYLSRMMVFHWLLLALLCSYLAAWQVGCTELSYFYSTRVVGSITCTLLESEFVITWFYSSRPKPNQVLALVPVLTTNSNVKAWWSLGWYQPR